MMDEPEIQEHQGQLSIEYPTSEIQESIIEPIVSKKIKKPKVKKLSPIVINPEQYLNDKQYQDMIDNLLENKKPITIKKPKEPLLIESSHPESKVKQKIAIKKTESKVKPIKEKKVKVKKEKNRQIKCSICGQQISRNSLRNHLIKKHHNDHPLKDTQYVVEL